MSNLYAACVFMYMYIMHGRICILVVYIECRDGDVRLVDRGNFNATAGRVEYCVRGLWGTVCNLSWEDADAAVVCRQLGLNVAGKEYVTYMCELNLSVCGYVFYIQNQRLL